MAVKSVIDIDVNDEAFNSFAAKFDSYREALNKLPGGWAKATTAAEQQKETFVSIAAAMMAANQQAQQSARQTTNFSNSSRSAAGSWKEIARAARDVSGSIISITGTLLKWTGIGAIFGGLLGVGSLFGLRHMAAGVAAGQRSSRGLGTTYGGQSAFGINYGQLVDSNAFLGSVNRGIHSATSEERLGMIGAGMSNAEMRGDTAQVAGVLLDKLKGIADRTNPQVLAETMRAFRLDSVTSLEDMMRLRAMSPDEYSKYRAGNTRDSSALDLDKNIQQKWVDFTQQMDRAGKELKNTFVRATVNLADPLKNLSGSLIKLVGDVGESETVQRWINRAAHGLEEFGKTVASGEFEKSVTTFVDNVGTIAENLVKFSDKVIYVLRKLHMIDDEPKPAPVADDVPAGFHFPMALNAPGTPEWEAEGARLDKKGITGWRPAAPANVSERERNRLEYLEKREGLPAGLLWATYGTESSFGANRNDSKASARGPFQFMPETAAEEGVINPYDFDEASEGIAKRYAKLGRMFNGDWNKAIAANNWGQGNVAAYLKTGKGVNGQPVPAETLDYMSKVRKLMPGDPNLMARYSGKSDQSMGTPSGIASSDLKAIVDALRGRDTQAVVTVMNNTGAQVSVQASQVARGP